MNLPKSGRVVVVDDEIDEALPLIKVLSQQKISTAYFSGRREDLPKEPFDDVRILFLDIVLEGFTGRDEKSILSALYKIIEGIISNKNGPFIIILWTKNEQYIDELKKMLKESDYRPVLILTLQKNECKKDNGAKEEYDFEKISAKISENMNKLNIYHLFLLWENIVYESASVTINEISRIIEFNDQWNDVMTALYHALAIAWGGRHIASSNCGEIFKNSLFTFKRIFEDTLEKNIKNVQNIPQINFDSNSEIDENIISKINTKLLIDSDWNEDFYPGVVYAAENEDFYLDSMFNNNCNSTIKYLRNDIIDVKELREQLKMCAPNTLTNSALKNLTKNYIDTMSNKLKKILLEVTPICDYLQQKMKLSRVVQGLLCPFRVSVTLDEKALTIETPVKTRTQYLYMSPIFEYEDEAYFVILDFRFFKSIMKDKIKDRKVLFRIRRDVLAEIQIKLSHHISRIGILFLDHRRYR